MSSSRLLPGASAMVPEQQNQILANDVVRRLLRTDPELLSSEAPRILNDYDTGLEYSGYSWYLKLLWEAEASQG